MNKQIEEMAKIVCGACDFICDCEYLMKDKKAYTWCDLPKEVCEALYNAGYRKVNDIVEKVTVERPAMCDLLNEELKSLMCGGKVCFTADEMVEQTNDLFKEIERTRKETAIEILQIFAGFRPCSMNFGLTWNALAEKYGVEVE